MARRRFSLVLLVVLIASLSLLVAGAPSSPADGRVHRRQQIESRAELPETTTASSSSSSSVAAASSGASQATASASVTQNPSGSASGNSTMTATTGGNSTATNNRNATSANATSTSSTSDRPRPQATDFTAQTLVAPAPAAQGGGNVAQSPDDSYIAAAQRNAMLGLSSVVALIATAAYFTL